MSRRVISLIILFLWLVSGFLSPVVPQAAATSASTDNNESFTTASLTSTANNSTSKMPFQVQVNTTSLSTDRDYDGLTDAVETNGWWNAAGFFTTDPLDPDSDDDGLTDGKEKLYDTDPVNDHSPGIYVEYEDHLKTRQYSARHPNSVKPWGWQQYGDQLISFNAVVVRRGVTFSVGGPADATIDIDKSLGYLTNLTPVRDVCTGRWRLSVPSGGTVGKYEITLQEGDWSKSLNLYVIFELPTPTSNFTQAMIDTFLYDDDPDNLRDEIGINLGTVEFTHAERSFIPEDAWVAAGYGYRVELQQFEPFIFEEHVIEAINGRNNQWDAARDLVRRTDKVLRFNFPRFLDNSWEMLYNHPEQGNQCSNTAAFLTALERSAGIPARPFFVDWVHRSFDHATEIWLNGNWYAARGYNVSDPEPEECVVDGVADCSYGSTGPRPRSTWGYSPWHSGGSGIGNVIMSADENWVWDEVDFWDGHEYRWPSWDWDAIVRWDWFDTLFVPYWHWNQEPEITGTPPAAWPAVTDFAIAASPGSQSAPRNNPTSYNVTLSDAIGNFSNIVDLFVTNLPPDTVAEFNSDNCVPYCSSTLIITPTLSTPIGTYSVTISGESGGLVREIDVELVVSDFTIDASPSSRTIAQRESTVYTVTLDALNDFDDVVDLSVTGLPDHATASFDPSSRVPPGNSTLTVSAESSTPDGTYILTISGDSGGLYHETTVELVVTPAPNFTINASPGSRSVEQGDSANYTVSLGAVHGFDDTVDLSVTGLPANTAAGFDPANCEPNCNSQLSVSTASDTPDGTYILTVSGDSGGLHNETTVEFVVTAPPDFTIDASPNSRTVEQGDSTDYTVNLEALNGFNDSVDLSVTGLPADTTADFDPGSCTPACSSTLSVVTTSSTPTGTHTLIIHGNRGPLHHQTSVALVVNEGGGVSGLSTSGLFVATSSTTGDKMTGDNQTGLTARGIHDYGIDLDGDGYFDQLVIEIEIDVPQPGTYWLQGELGANHLVPTLAWSGGIIAADVVRADMAEGTQVVRLYFDGLQISAAQVDGPYVLKYLSITDVDDPGPDEFANNLLDHWRSLYTTAAYQVYDFENLGAALSGDITERGLDADSDGLYESLTLNVGLDILKPGTYTVQGNLYDKALDISDVQAQERFIARATWTGTGSTASLQFDELAGTVGPYTLEDVYLRNADGEIIDSMGDTYTTQQVTKAEGKTHIVDQADLDGIGTQAILPETYSDSGIDVDDDGLYDLLVIDVLVEAEETGQYRLEGWLERDGHMISWTSSDSVNLAAGTTHNFSLPFSGPAINAHNTDGPFTLTTLKLVSGNEYEVVDEINIAYTTSAYAHDQFESHPHLVLAEDHVLLFEDRMENGTNNWTADEPWTLIDAEFHSPTHSWTDSPNGNYADDSSLFLTSGPISLWEFSRPTLQFQTCHNLRTDDYGLVEISTNGGTIWTTIAAYTDRTVHWSSRVVDLGVIGDAETLQVRFRLETNGSGTADGWYIDNVAVYFDNDLDDDGITNGIEVGDDPTAPVDTDNDDTPDYLDDDSDNDGILDSDEGSGDADQDGTPNYQDPDSDNDGIPDRDEGNDDVDGDGDPNYLDEDSDGDGLPDSDEGTGDTDQDGIPDYLDNDSDNDGIPDPVEIGDDPGNPMDTDNDGTPDYQDIDSDDDGIPDTVEAGNTPTNPIDTDQDGTDDYRDIDSDNDYIADDVEYDIDQSICPNLEVEQDADDIPNCQDNDADGDTIPNYLDPDSDNDGIPDSTEAGDHDLDTPPIDNDRDGLPNFIDPDDGNFIYLPIVVK